MTNTKQALTLADLGVGLEVVNAYTGEAGVIRSRIAEMSLGDAVRYEVEIISGPNAGELRSIGIGHLFMDWRRVAATATNPPSVPDSHVAASVVLTSQDVPGETLQLPQEIAEQLAPAIWPTSIAVQIHDPAHPDLNTLCQAHVMHHRIDAAPAYLRGVDWPPSVTRGTTVELVAMRTGGRTSLLGIYVRR